MKKRGLTVIAVIFIVMTAVFVYLHLKSNESVVLRGLTMQEARNIVNTEKNCYIVTEGDGGSVIEFHISYGADEGVPVELTGKSPRKYLSNIFFISKNNSFLIRGTEYNEHYKGNSTLDAYAKMEDMFSIEVESWEIITPIGRDYTYEKHGRLIYPTDYLDKYDVEYGDYVLEGK